MGNDYNSGYFTGVYNVFKREFRLLLASPLLYAAFGAYLLVAGITSINTIHATGIVTIKPYFQIAPYMILLFSIAISSPMLLRRDGRRDFALMVPGMEMAAVTGKLLVALLILLFPLLAGVLVIITMKLASWGSADTGVWVSGTLGLALLGMAFSSIGLLVSSTQKNFTSAFLISFMIAFFMWIPDFLGEHSSELLGSILRNISFSYHVKKFSLGLVQLVDIVYFIGISVLGIKGILISMKVRNGYALFRAFSPVYTLVIIAAVILANISAVRLDISLDMTRDKLFTLDNTTKKELKKLDMPLKVIFFCSSKIPGKLKYLRNDVINILKQYSRYSGNFSVTVLDPDTDLDARRLASDYKVNEIEVGNYSRRKTSIDRIFFGIAMILGDKTEVIPEAINAARYRTLEYELTFRLKRITGKRVKILFSVGNGEEPSEEDLRAPFSRFFSLLNEYEFKKVIPGKDDLSEGELLIIAGPNISFSQDAINSLEKFIDSGKPVMLFLDGMKTRWNKAIAGLPMHWIVNDTGMNKLLSKRGIEINHDLVLSFRAPKIPVSRHQTMTYPLMPYIQVNSKLMVVPYTVSSFSLKNPEKFKYVMKTTNEAWRHVNAYEEDRKWPVTKDRGPFITGFLYKKGKEKIFGFGDSDILRDKGFESVSTHIIFLRHFINELLDDRSLSHLRFKGRSVSWISPAGKSPFTVQLYSCILPTLIVILFGVMYNLLRKRKKGEYRK
ncbi:MAG: Gldg family protein [Deltaproteobacteria bacterium]|nr:Gldg family protein [Deltaproteobacteria bacterium]